MKVSEQNKHRKLLYRDEQHGFELWRESAACMFKAEILSGEVDREFIDALEQPTITTIENAYTLDGDYIGDEKLAKYLCVQNRIKPEKLTPSSKVCSIGYSNKDGKWYGWSHRAIYGFSIGDVAKEGDCVTTSGWTDEYLQEHPEADVSLPVGFEAKTIEDAKRMAIAFAESVS